MFGVKAICRKQQYLLQSHTNIYIIFTYLASEIEVTRVVSACKLVIKKGKIIIGELWLLNEVSARKALIEYNKHTQIYLYISTYIVYIYVYVYICI